MRQRVRNMLQTDNGAVLVFVAVLCWVGNFLVARSTAGIVPPVALAFFRWLIAGAIVTAFYWRPLVRDWPVIWRNRGWVLLLGVAGIGIYNSFIYIGLQSTLVLNLLVLNASVTLMVALLSYVFFRERLSIGQMAGILLSTVGVLWIVLRGDPAALLDLQFHRGDVWILSGVLAYAVYMAFLRKSPKIHPMSLIAVTFMIGTLFNLPFVMLEMAEGRFVQWADPRALLSIAYVVIFPSIIAYICFNRGVAILGGTRASTIMLTSPVVGAVLAMLFLGERLTVVHLVGGFLVFSGILVSRRKAG